MGKSLSAILFSFTVGILNQTAQAQDYNAEPRIPHNWHRQGEVDFVSKLIRQAKAIVVPTTIGFDPYFQKMSLDFAAYIHSTYQNQLAALSYPKRDCSSAEMTSYIRGLKTAGRFDQCISEADRCSASLASKNTQMTLLEGAFCADKIFRYKKAYQLFDIATSKRFEKEEYFDLALYRFALFAWSTQYSQKIDDILKRHPTWTLAERNLIHALIDYLNKGITQDYTKDTLDTKTFELMGRNNEFANEMAIGWLNNLIWNRYDHLGAIKFLENNLVKIHDLDRILRNINLAFYSLDTINFKLTKNILDAYYEYTNRYSRFSVEDNIFTVSEQYNQVCKDSLAQGDVFKQLQSFKEQWKSGENPQRLLELTLKLNEENPDKADILTLLGSLYSALNKEDLALDSYWKAHQACHYYHRSHWGLGDILKNQKYRAFDDYTEIRKRVETDLESITFSPKIVDYVMNWKTLTEEHAKGVKHALRYYADFVDGLVAAKTHLYIKQVYEFESEIPGYESDRDQRADPPDNRSLDELRGRGGNPVISDLGETLRTPHGDYNLGVHEIAHSWHLDYLPFAKTNHLTKCITQLYENAKKRNVFAEPYSASNEMEYFAQAVGYYQIPKDAPARYGLTVEWIVSFDPDMYAFLKSIEQSKGDMSKIVCPVQ